MQNPDDYQMGWTTPIYHPHSGRPCYGGAARNVRLRFAGGVAAVENAAALSAMQYIQPLIENLQQQLKVSTELNQQMAQELMKHRQIGAGQMR